MPVPACAEGSEAAFEDYPVEKASTTKAPPVRKARRSLMSSITDALKGASEAKPSRPAVLVAKASLLGGVYGLAAAVL